MHVSDVDAASPEFLQQRVARFGRSSTALFGAFLAVRVGIALAVDDLGGLAHPTYWLHGIATLCAGAIWGTTAGQARSKRFVRVIEGSGLIAACMTLQVLGLYLPSFARPDLVVLAGMTLGLFARSVYVPSSARRTLMLCITIGIRMCSPRT